MHILKIFCIVFILFFPGKQRCWRWRLLLNIKCQLFLNCSCSSAVQYKLRPPPSLASSAQCSPVQASAAQLFPACTALHRAVHSRRNYTIFGQSKVDSAVQCSNTLQCAVLRCSAVAASCTVRGGP